MAVRKVHIRRLAFEEHNRLAVKEYSVVNLLAIPATHISSVLGDYFGEVFCIVTQCSEEWIYTGDFSSLFSFSESYSSPPSGMFAARFVIEL